MAACSEEPPLPGYTPHPALVAADPNPAMIRDVPAHPGLQAPVDHMIVILEQGETRATAERLSAGAMGELVGAAEDIGFYQLRLSTRTMVELEAAIATVGADPAVRSAGYDFLVQWRACPAAADVIALDTPEFCPWDDSEFAEALTAFEEMDLDLSNVAVGVIDTGIQRDNGEFDDVRLADATAAHGSASGLVDMNGHGTRVAGIIAADDGDGGVNGIASRFLGPRLQLIWGLNDPNLSGIPSAARIVISTRKAIAAGARIVNLSLGFGPFAATPTGEDTTVRNGFVTLAEMFPEVLFVVAAGNADYVLTDRNDAPAGIARPNVITVGSHLPCMPMTRSSLSSSGERVEIVAQGENVPLVGVAVGGAITSSSGTSLAAPQVTSVAAILASMDPSLSPRELRRLILDNALPGPASTSPASLSIAGPFQQLLLEMGKFSEQIDSDGDGLRDRAGIVAQRFCGGSSYEVYGYGSYSYPPPVADTMEEGTMALGFIGESGLGWNLLREGSDALGATCSSCAFNLQSYAISEDGPMHLSFTRGTAASDISATGNVISGQWTLTKCAIIERYPSFLGFDDAPITVLLTSEISGSMEVSDAAHDDPVTVPFGGAIEINAMVEPFPPDHPTVALMERLCEGGRDH